MMKPLRHYAGLALLAAGARPLRDARPGESSRHYFHTPAYEETTLQRRAKPRQAAAASDGQMIAAPAHYHHKFLPCRVFHPMLLSFKMLASEQQHDLWHEFSPCH